LARVLTARRKDLLSYVRHHDVRSIRELSTGLQRDYSNVHADVRALVAEGLLDIEGGRPRANYDVIETRIAL
jgi:predicted transcriptional regulator